MAAPATIGLGAVDHAECLPGNYMPDACIGCVIVRGPNEKVEAKSVPPDAPPFHLDPADKAFTVANTSKEDTWFTWLTFAGVRVFDRDGQAFPSGDTRGQDGAMQRATTFIIVVGPQTALKLCSLEMREAPELDVVALPFERLRPPPQLTNGPDGADLEGVAFPLPASHGPYLCTQGVGGHLTHFFPESYHALDFRCSIGTPVLSIGSGVVREVEQKHSCGGIHVSNLSLWNAVSIDLDCGLLAEYVHIRPGSAVVAVGDRVAAGQVVCESGDIGFAPEPHLHIELHRSSDPEGPSVPLRFQVGSTSFVPVAGRWYLPTGPVEAPEGSSDVPMAVAPRERSAERASALQSSPRLCGSYSPGRAASAG